MKKLISMAAVAALLFTGCAKDGDTGPAGATGPQGAQGNPGVSQIKKTDFVIAGSDWQSVSSTDKFFELDLPELTLTVLNNSSILVYKDNITYMIQLPYTQYTSGTISYTPYFETYKIIVHGQSATAITPPSGTTYWKVIIVSGFLRQANPNVNWNNYAEVASTFNLE